MKPTRALLAAAFFVTVPIAGVAGEFSDVFVDGTLRVDVHLFGDADTGRVALDRVIRYDGWAGPVHGRLDDHPGGRFVARLVAPEDGSTLYRIPFDSLFGEYETTAPAQRGTVRVFHESVLFPQPSRPVRLVIDRREPDGAGTVLLDVTVDPAGADVAEGQPRSGVDVVEVRIAGPPSTSLDIAIIGEGYAAGDATIFRTDLARFAELLLGQRPYAELADRISIRGLVLPSAEPGCDEPTRGIWRDTAVDASFNTLGSPRYLLTENNSELRDIAANAPYDTLIVMVNHDRYGGGGIFNRYCTFTAHGPHSGYLLLHELGHSFGGLADEYYTSATAYTDFYPAGTEPAEPNITASTDRTSLKWADLIDPATPLPTPWSKKDYDRQDLAYQEVRQSIDEAIARAARADALAVEREILARAAAAHTAERMAAIDVFVEESGLAGVVGAFEGAGYASQGLYRPAIDCLMFSRGVKPLCPVCRRAVAARIDFYTGQ